MKIFKFLELEANNDFLKTISKNIKRRNKKISSNVPSVTGAKEEVLCGEIYE